MAIPEHTPTYIVRMVEYGSCPDCGDRLIREVCANRAGRCGKDWGPAFREAKKVEALKKGVGQ